MWFPLLLIPGVEVRKGDSRSRRSTEVVSPMHLFHGRLFELPYKLPKCSRGPEPVRVPASKHVVHEVHVSTKSGADAFRLSKRKTRNNDQKFQEFLLREEVASDPGPPEKVTQQGESMFEKDRNFGPKGKLLCSRLVVTREGIKILVELEEGNNVKQSRQERSA
jgi:hypothetical protein